jgi:hypothetical protein
LQDKSHFLTAYNLFAEFPNFMLEKNIFWDPKNEEG